MDFDVRSESYAPESRGWLRGPHGTEPGTNPEVVLDLALFDAEDHYPDGYIKSGCVIAKVTASGLYGPYDNAASDGRQTAKGLLFSSEIVKPGQAKALSAMVVHAFVDPDRLPYTGVPGALDSAGRADLTLIYWD